MSGEKVIHLDASQAHRIREELISARQRLLDEQSDDSARLNRLRDLIDALCVSEPPPA